MKKLGAPMLAVVALALALAAAGCGPSGAAVSPADPRLPVRVALVERRDVPVTLGAIGRVDPLASVLLKPQIAGMLSEVHFAEGDEVREGDLLLELDRRPFESDVRAAEARLARDRTLAQDAREAADQLSSLRAGDAISERQSKQALANARAAESTVAADEAALEMANLRLEYCSIRAPFDGRTGALEVHRGSVVKADETELVLLNRMSPIRVVFAVPQRHLAEIRAQQARSPLQVEVRLPDGGAPEEGELSFIDNSVDASTGTIRLMASFANEERRLWPGLYVDVVLTVSVDEGVLVAPTRAIQSGRTGDTTFVVAEDGTVEQRELSVARTVDGIAVVASGLDEGDAVVVEGQLRLVPGARVRLLDEPDAPPAGAPTSTMDAGAGS